MVKYFTIALGVLCGPNAFTQRALPTYVERITDRIELDGRLVEPAWQNAKVLSNFLQFYPNIGGAATEATHVRVLYDNNYMYIGVMAFDSASSQIMATGLERDVYYSSDDHVCITLDTYNDKRQGILLSTNALSARFDEEVFENGNGFNAAYNTFWSVRSSRSDEGYAVEFQIPFSSLRFEPSQRVTMGIKVIRYIKRKNEFDIFPATDATVANAVWRVNNSQEIIFMDLKARKPFYLIPYAKADYQERRSWNGNKNQVDKRTQFLNRNYFSQASTLDKVISNIGFDIKYGLSKNFTLDATLNTDFAQAESDNRVLNFTRFAINLPEKRNFFLESKDYLTLSTGSGMLLFNSRTIGIDKGLIVPIIGGVRLSGKSNGFQLGFLDLQTLSNNQYDIAPQHFSVLRVRKEVWGNGSYLGGIVTNRMSTGGNALRSQTVGLDAVKRFRDNKWILGMNIGITNDKNSPPAKFGEKNTSSINLSRVSSLGFNHTSIFEYTGKYFRPRVGFAPDSAYLLTNVSNGYIWKWKQSEKRNLFWFTHLVNYKYRTINKTHESIYTELEFGSSYKSGATLLLTPLFGREYLPYTWNFRGDIMIPLHYYTYTGVRVRYDSRQTNRVNYSAIGQFNGFYGGNRFNFLLNGYYAINRNFRFTYKYEFNAFQFPKAFSLSWESTYQSNLFALGLAYTQSIYFSAKAFVQYDDISKTIGGNFRLRINPKEGTDLYIVYNPRINVAFERQEGRRTTMVDQQTFIVKFSKALAF